MFHRAPWTTWWHEHASPACDSRLEAWMASIETDSRRRDRFSERSPTLGPLLTLGAKAALLAGGHLLWRVVAPEDLGTIGEKGGPAIMAGFFV